MAHDVFVNATSCMTRNKKHNRIALWYIQEYDPPVNCAPTLHGLDMLILHNLVQSWNLPGKYKHIEDLVKNSALHIFPTILHIEQHTYSDIGLAIYASELICKRYRISFDNLENELTSTEMKLKYPGINFELMFENYRHVKHISSKRADETRLSEVTLDYYADRGFKQTKPGEYNFFMDRKGNLQPYLPK